METLDTGKDKIKKICDIIKDETLEPAKQEAQKVIEVAQEQAHALIRDAEKQAEELIRNATEKMEKEKTLFESSLRRASKQGVEALRQEIETKLFNDSLSDWVEKATVDPKLGATLIQALVEAVQKEGLSVDFSAYVASKISPEKVNAALSKEILQKLREKEVRVADFIGGVQLKLHDRKLTLDLSDEALEELLSRYIRKNFRELFFQ